MPSTTIGVHVTSLLGLGAFLVLWIIVVRLAHVALTLVRHDPLIGWAVGPLGVTTLFLHEPSLLYALSDLLFPALVSGSILYVGLFTRLPSALALPRTPLIEVAVIAAGVLLSSLGGILNFVRDLCYPLWGEARILRTIQLLRASWATIHFTPSGLSYLRDHFGFSPNDLIQAF